MNIMSGEIYYSVLKCGNGETVYDSIDYYICMNR